MRYILFTFLPVELTFKLSVNSMCLGTLCIASFPVQNDLSTSFVILFSAPSARTTIAFMASPVISSSTVSIVQSTTPGKATITSSISFGLTLLPMIL